MLTDLQLEIAGIVSDVAGPAGFALAGGGALIVQHVVDRQTRDLDFFTQQPETITPTAALVEERLRDAGLAVTRPVDNEGFVRLEARRGEAVCEVDLGHDARRWPVIEQPGVGPVISLEELAADKTLALVGRAAVRDFLDVQALDRLLGAERLCELAADKDLGFTKGHLADALDRIHRFARDQFPLDNRDYAELHRWAREWNALLREQERTPGAG